MLTAESINRSHSQTQFIEWLTVERLVYGSILLVGLFARFFAISEPPLSTSEAIGSWAAWISAHGLQSAVPQFELLVQAQPPNSSLLYSSQALLFWVSGGSDGLARFWPAVVGSGLILLPWFIREEIGRFAAIVLALLFAIDPWLIAFSRLADSTMLSVLAGVLVLSALARLANSTLPPTHKSRWQTALWSCGGLLLISGPQAWSFSLVLLLFVGMSQIHRRKQLPGTDSSKPSADVDRDDQDSDALPTPDRAAANHRANEDTTSRFDLGYTGTNLSLFAAAALLGATGWLAFPEGLGYVATSLSVWVEQLTGAGTADEADYSLNWLALRLLADQALLIFLGLIALGLLYADWDESDSQLFNPLFLSGWMAIGFILLLAPGRVPASLIIFHLPLLLATARLGGRLLTAPYTQGWRYIAWQEIAILSAILTILCILGALITSAQVANTQLSLPYLLTAVLLIGLAVLMIAVMALLTHREQALWFAGLYLALLLVITMFSSSWQLNHRHDPLSPDALFNQFTAQDIRLLVDDIQTLSAQRVGDPEEIPIRAEMQSYPDPLLAWYLRGMRNLTWSAAPTADSSSDSRTIFLTFRDSVTNITAGETYLGSDYDLRLRWLPEQLPTYEADEQAPERSWQENLQRRWSEQLQPLLRWILYRKVQRMPETETVVLWTSRFE